MLLIVIICLAIIIAVLVYEVIRREITKHATLIVRNDAQRNTDQAMKEAVKSLVTHQIVRPNEIDFGESQTVADVWGKGVMAFEYVLHSDLVEKIDLKQVHQVLNQGLAQYENDHQISRVPKAQEAFLVTDAWVYEQQLHIDVAYIINDATYQYIYDLKKID
jgi:hypothetical protein